MKIESFVSPSAGASNREVRNVAHAEAYLRAIEQGAVGEELARFFAEDVVQEELPNRLVANGARRTLPDILAGAVRGQAIMRSQRFEVISATPAGERVVLEVLWVGIPLVAVGAIPPGGELRAHSAVVLEFRGERIAAQRNYDRFEPF